MQFDTKKERIITKYKNKNKNKNRRKTTKGKIEVTIIKNKSQISNKSF